MKVYITKYCLTKGIIELEVEQTSQSGVVRSKNQDGHKPLQCWHSGDWCSELHLAQQQAETMRNHKIASLKAQIAKLEKLVF